MDDEALRLLKLSYDQELNEVENEKLEHALRKDPELRAEARKLQKLRDLMYQDETGFSPFFTEKVMNRIDMLINDGYRFAFSRIAMPSLAAAIILLLISFWGGHSFTFDALMGVENLKPEYITDFLLYTN